MPRFVSIIASHGIQSGVWEDYATGGKKEIVKPIEAVFTRGAPLSEYETEFAVKSLRLARVGLPEDVETNSDVHPSSRLRVLDTESYAAQVGLTPEEHDLMVDVLRKSSSNGVEYVEIERLTRPSPFARWDEIGNAEVLLATLDVTGGNPLEALAYERENQNRADVVEALEELLGDDVESQVVIEA